MKTIAKMVLVAAAGLSPAFALPLGEVTDREVRIDPFDPCYTVEGEVVCPPEDHPTIQQMSQGAGAPSPEPIEGTRGSEAMPGEDGASGAP